jgi:hypothetical protein
MVDRSWIVPLYVLGQAAIMEHLLLYHSSSELFERMARITNFADYQLLLVALRSFTQRWWRPKDSSTSYNNTKKRRPAPSKPASSPIALMFGKILVGIVLLLGLEERGQPQ